MLETAVGEQHRALKQIPPPLLVLIPTCGIEEDTISASYQKMPSPRTETTQIISHHNFKSVVIVNSKKEERPKKRWCIDGAMLLCWGSATVIAKLCYLQSLSCPQESDCRLSSRNSTALSVQLRRRGGESITRGFHPCRRRFRHRFECLPTLRLVLVHPWSRQTDPHATSQATGTTRRLKSCCLPVS